MKHKAIKALVPATRVDLGPGDQYRRDSAPRLTCDVVPEPDGGWLWRLRLDGRSLGGAEFVRATSEPAARAAAQAYIDELLVHFRAGGT